MTQLLLRRLLALDPDAASALQAIACFDDLVNQRAGLESVVRQAAGLSGAAARLLTSGRTIPLRVLPSGRRADDDCPAQPSWQCQSIPEAGITMWLERPGPSGPVDEMVLERATQAVWIIVERTWGRQRTGRPDDCELMEVLLDPTAAESARADAARALGFHHSEVVRVVAEAGAPLRVVPVTSANGASPAFRARPIGIGPAVPVEQAESSARAATLALRLCGGGTPADPGPRTLQADDLGVILLIAEAFDGHPVWRNHPDLAALRKACAQRSWALPTLTALVTTDSLRAASAAIVIHHSSLRKRLKELEKLLGWDVTTPLGKFRAQVTVVLSRLDSSRG
jgi:PucR-like helix-turn-helix protein